MMSPASEPSLSVSCSAVFDQFQLVTLSFTEGNWSSEALKLPCDAVPPSLGPHVLAIIYSSLWFLKIFHMSSPDQETCP